MVTLLRYLRTINKNPFSLKLPTLSANTEGCRRKGKSRMCPNFFKMFCFFSKGRVPLNTGDSLRVPSTCKKNQSRPCPPTPSSVSGRAGRRNASLKFFIPYLPTACATSARVTLIRYLRTINKNPFSLKLPTLSANTEGCRRKGKSRMCPNFFKMFCFFSKGRVPLNTGDSLRVPSTCKKNQSRPVRQHTQGRPLSFLF